MTVLISSLTQATSHKPHVTRPHTPIYAKVAASFAASTSTLSFSFFFCSLLSPLSEPTTLTSSRSSAPTAASGGSACELCAKLWWWLRLLAPKHRPLQFCCSARVKPRKEVRSRVRTLPPPGYYTCPPGYVTIRDPQLRDPPPSHVTPPWLRAT